MSGIERSSSTFQNYVSFIDDPRITMDMAIEFENILKEDWEEAEHDFLNSILANLKDDNSVLFPIKTIEQLESRLLELQSWLKGKEAYYNSKKRILSVAFKVASKQLENRFAWTCDNYGDYGNPELQLLLETYKNLLGRHSQFAYDYFERALSLEESDFDNVIDPEYKILTIKMKSFISGLIWTATNNGRCTYNTAKDKSNNIQEQQSMENIKTLYLNGLLTRKKNISIKNNSTGDHEILPIEMLVSQLPIVFSTNRLNPEKDDLEIMKIGNLVFSSGMLRQGRMIDALSIEVENCDTGYLLSFK